VNTDKIVIGDFTR